MLFSNIYRDSAIAILKTYGTPKKLAKAHVSKVASLLHGRCKCTSEQLIAAAKSSVCISELHYAFQLTDAIEEMEHIARHIKNYDIQIKAYVDELYPNLLSIPGVGYTTTGLITGEIRDIRRFHSAESLISYSGIDVTVYESGKYKAKNCMPSKKGSKYLRYALFQVSRIIWQHDSYYEKKQAEGKHYYVILGHIQKKVVRVLFHFQKRYILQVRSLFHNSSVPYLKRLPLGGLLCYTLIALWVE